VSGSFSCSAAIHTENLTWTPVSVSTSRRYTSSQWATFEDIARSVLDASR
jgi:hypothetical protein